MDVESMDELVWQEVPIPGSTPAVSVARVHGGADGSFLAFVRFPTGWRREGAGWYDHIEEVLWIDGQFTMSGRTYSGGDHTWFPAGYSRVGSSTGSGALALAWFSGPSRWSTGPSPVGDGAARGAVISSWGACTPVPSPLGPGVGRLLIRGAAHSSWMADDVPAGDATRRSLDLFSLSARTWARCEPGQAIPAMAGPVYCRIGEDEGTVT